MNKRTKQLIEEAKELGLESIEVNGVKYNFHSNLIIAQSPPEEKKPSELMKPLSILDDLTDEQILYWSTPHFDEIEAIIIQRNEELKSKE